MNRPPTTSAESQHFIDTGKKPRITLAEFKTLAADQPAQGQTPVIDPTVATDSEILEHVESFNDSTEGPIRFPDSIAESNQGPDPRYQPWMDRCLALAKQKYGTL